MSGDLRSVLNADWAKIARQLERERNRPVGDPMSEAEARKLTDRIKFAAEQLWDRIVEAYHGRADRALGYDSWDAYCIAEFDSLRIRIPREERDEVVKSLRDAGLSDRAIESATGISRSTLIRDKHRLGGINDTTSEPVDEEELIAFFEPADAADRAFGNTIIGTDGKLYAPKRERTEPLPVLPPPPPPPPPPAPSSDAEMFDDELEVLDKSVDVMTWLIDRDQLSEDERILLAGRVADYSGRLQVIANKLRQVTPSSAASTCS